MRTTNEVEIILFQKCIDSTGTKQVTNPAFNVLTEIIGNYGWICPEKVTNRTKPHWLYWSLISIQVSNIIKLRTETSMNTEYPIGHDGSNGKTVEHITDGFPYF
jgi:hypothetical protein